MKKKSNNNQVDLYRMMIAGAGDISRRIMALSNQGLISYTPDQLLPDDNPDLSFLISMAIVSLLACEILTQDIRYKAKKEQVEAQVHAIQSQDGDSQEIVEQIHQAIRIECSNVASENQELIMREAEKRITKAVEFLEDKYKTRFEWMMTSLVMDSIISVTPLVESPSIVKSLHALEGWIVQEDLKLPKKESRGRKPNYDFTKLPDYYRVLREIWESAKEEAQKAQNDPLLKGNWRKRTQASYSYDLPDDLIEWLNEDEQERQNIFKLRTDLKFLSKKLKDGYVISKPSEFALEHSARLCGVPPYYYSTARLFEIRKKQALWFKTPL